MPLQPRDLDTSPRLLTVVSTLLVMLVPVVLVVTSVDALWSQSVDLAHHYALVFRLSEGGNLTNALDSSLGEMNVYPRLSHRLAAALGQPLGSVVLGMQASALLAIALIWMSLGAMVLSLPAKAAAVSVFSLAGLLVVNRFQPFADLHGGEVIGNFFFAQLVAQAFVVLAVAFTLHWELRSGGAALRNALLGIVTVTAAGIHLLPAIELLLFMGALCVVDTLRHWLARDLTWRTAVPVLLVLCTGVALGLHPTVAVMNDLSSNNGLFQSQAARGVNAAIAAGVLLSLSSAGMLWNSLFGMTKAAPAGPVTLKYIGAYGLAVSAGCVAQAVALKLGHGSEYAVQKHLMAVHTALFIHAAVFSALIAGRLQPSFWVPGWRNAKGRAPALLLLAGLTATAFHLVTPAKPLLDVSDLADLERKLVLLRDQRMPHTAWKYDHLQRAGSMPPVVEYMMSIGVLRAPRMATPQYSQTSLDWNHVGTLVTSENSELDRYPACRRSPPAGSLVMLDGDCVARSLPQRHVIGFTTDYPPHKCTTTGLSVVEAFGTWTDGNASSLHCPVPASGPDRPQTVLIDTVAFLNLVPMQRVSVAIRGQPPLETRYDAQHPGHVLQLKLPQNTGTHIDIDFRLDDAVSPYQLGLGKDMRRIAVAIRSIEFK